ncbi:TraB/GumN family protein [Piscibacillus halophilus]|uniref:TraB/GumN family protein n=1 Tax=Piscibacillus halophilus TaxID=571933 RepID=UPI00158C9ED5|nr:TraB/GumN family protein [Piscibacillus halophilus]
MKRFIYVFSLVLFLIIAGCTDSDQETQQQDQDNTDTEEMEEADSNTDHAEDEAEEVEGERPEGFLWKVEQGPTTVYLLGTIHIAPRDFFPLSETVEQAYEESDVVVPEIDMNNIDMFEMEQVRNQYASYQDGTTLEDHISPELYEQIEDIFEGTIVPMESVKQYKPWFVTNQIEQMKILELGYTDGVDQYFLNKADSDEKEVVALETVEDQLSIFADLSEDYQIEMLEETIESQDNYEEELNGMLEVYRQGDEEALLDMLIVEEEESDPEDEAYLTALNDERNYHMAEQIQEFLEAEEDQTYFVIVGSLHLTLEPHIGSILEEEGYEVTRVN